MPKEFNRRRYITNWDEVPVIIDIPYVASIIGMTYEYTRRMIMKGEIPAHKVGNSWRINKNELREYLGA